MRQALYTQEIPEVTHHASGISFSPFIDLIETKEKGRGVIAARDIAVGTVLEISPVFVIPPVYYDIVKAFPFITHTFVWRDCLTDRSKKTGAIAYGLISFCNHARTPNAKISRDYQNKTIKLIAQKQIFRGEEITIKYNNVWFKVVK